MLFVRYLVLHFWIVFLILSMPMEAVALELNEAIQRAWASSPSVSVASLEIDIKQAEECQAGLLPNPAFSIEIDGDNSFGSGDHKGNDQDITYSLSQLFELGGKRYKRKQIAAFETSLAAYELESIRLDILNLVTKAVVDVAAAQEYVKLAEEQKRIANEIYATTAAKVQSGKISSLQEKKANVARVSADLAVEKAYRALELSKKKLAATWGSHCPDFSDVVFPLFDVLPLSDLKWLISQQRNNLEAIKWDMQIAAAEKIIANEKAQRIPDVVVTAGYVSSHDDDDGLLLQFDLPIPVFNRNQGNISRAKQQLNQLYAQKEESMIQLRIELEEAYDQLVTAYKESLSFQENILSSARMAFEAAKEEYMKGKNDYLELLDAQRMHFEVQEQYINALVSYHQTKADVNRLVGLPLYPVNINGRDECIIK